MSKKSPKISVIVACYNLENYISRCMDSLIQQSFDDLEIIAVDDGSTDASLKKLIEYETNYSNVRILSQQNQGLSAARNAGIEIAQGKYLTFVDIDDYVDCDIYRKANEALVDNQNPDLLVFNYSCDYDNGNRMICHTDDMRPMNTETDGGPKYFLENLLSHNHSNSVCNKLFKKEIVDRWNLRFSDTKEVFLEDCCFTWRFAIYMRSVCAIHNLGYHYCIRNNSLGDVKGYNRKPLDCFPKIVNLIQKDIETMQKESLYEKVMPLIFEMLTVAYLINYKHIVKTDISGELERYSHNIDKFNEYFRCLADKETVRLLKQYTIPAVKSRKHSKIKPIILLKLLCSRTPKIAKAVLEGDYSKAEKLI